MTDATPPGPSSSPSEPSPGVGVTGGRDVTVGGDVAGRDVVKSTTTVVGFGPREVQRLVLTVGTLVFVTAACFFSGGVVVGGAALAAFDRDVGSSEAAALRFASRLQALQALPPGQSFILPVSEDEISSYFRFVLAPQIGVTDGKVRLLETPGELVVGGQSQGAGNLPFRAVFVLDDALREPFRLKSAAVRLLGAGNTGFGWVAVPAALLQPLADRVNALFPNVQLLETVETQAVPERIWAVSGVSR